MRFLSPIISLAVCLTISSCSTDQIKTNQKAIETVQKQVKANAATLGKIDLSGEGTARTLVQITAKLGELDASNNRLKAQAFEQGTLMADFRLEQEEAVAEFKKGVDTQLDASDRKVREIDSKVAEHGAAALSAKMDKAKRDVTAQLEGVDQRIGLIEANLPRDKEAAAIDHLHDDIQTKLTSIEQIAREGPPGKTAGSVLPLGMTQATVAGLALGSFVLAIFLLFLLFFRTGKLSREVVRMGKELQDLASAQRIQSRMAQQTTKLSIGSEDESAKESLETFKHLLESDENKVQHLFNIGTSFEELGSFRIAKEWFDSCVKINSGFTNGWIEKGICLAMLGNLKEAEICMERALKQNPNNARAWYNKAAIAARLGNEEEMLEAVSKSVEADSGAKRRLREDKDFEKYWDNAEFTSRTA